jgi:putative sigma-54 modulation protein
MQIAVGATSATAVPVVVHKFPSIARTTEAHLVPNSDAVAMRPMTVEEAVKECEFRDREVFVFRDAKGKVKVLHRRKDGKIELIEVP